MPNVATGMPGSAGVPPASVCCQLRSMRTGRPRSQALFSFRAVRRQGSVCQPICDTQRLDPLWIDCPEGLV